MAAPRQRSRGLAIADPVTDDEARGGMAFVIDAVRVRPGGRRTLSLLSLSLLVVGVAMFLYPLATDLYVTRVVQSDLRESFDRAEVVEQYRSRAVPVGDPLTRIRIDAIGVDAIVVEGTSAAALRAGAGHYPSTPLPGEVGNVAIAGHRTTYGRPFNRIDELAVGEELTLETPLDTHTYRVVEAPEGVGGTCPTGACWVTDPSDWGVVAPIEDASLLTLTTCHPKGSARQRLILRAELVASEPRVHAVAPGSVSS